MGLAAPKPVSYAEYLQLERDTDTKHEYIDGVAYAMAGGSMRHGYLISRLFGAVSRRLDETPCEAVNSETKLRILASGRATYPDFSVVCGPPEAHPEDPNAYTNPVLIVEVLSDSTEAWDRGGKFDAYGEIETLRYYLLANTAHDQLELFTRLEDGVWSLQRFRSGQVAIIPSLGISLDVDALYADLPAPPPGRRPRAVDAK